MAFLRVGSGGIRPSGNLMPPLNSLVYAQPSNTTQVNTTKRTFVKNTYGYGLNSINTYYPSAVSNIQLGSNTFSAKTVAYGLHFVLSDAIQAGKTYKLDWTHANDGSDCWALFYASDGTYLDRIRLQYAFDFTVPNNAQYVLLFFDNYNNQVSSGTINSLTEVIL